MTEIKDTEFSLTFFKVFEIIFLLVAGTGLTIFAYTQIELLLNKVLFLCVVMFSVFMILYTSYLELIKKS